MSTTTESGLVCLEATDYAAIALAMQETGQATSDALSSISANLTTYNNRPWASAVTTAAGSVNNNLADFVLGTQPPGGLAIHSLAHTTTASGLSGLPTMTLPPAGWYLAGATCTFQPTGAVNAQTRRDLILTWSYTINGFSQWDQQSVHTYYESNTGGDAGSLTGLFFADGQRNYTLAVTLMHKNTGSTVQVNVGARYWVSYLGTGVVI